MTDPLIPGQGEAAHWRAACSEFPNDNPELHEGAVWVCQAVRARPRAVLRAEPVVSVERVPGQSVLRFDLVFPELATEAEGQDVSADERGSSDVREPEIAETSLNESELADTSLNESEAADTSLSESESDAATPRNDADASDLRGEVNLQAADDLLWRSQLEAQDPFLSELAALIAGTSESPLGIFDPALSADSVEPSRAAALQSGVQEPLEPISLEGFVTGEMLPLANAPRRVQSLKALELSTDIESLSGTEKAWDDVVQPLSAFLLDRGATHAAIVLPRLLAGDSVSVVRLPRAAQQCLIAEDFASEHEGTVLIRPEFRARARRLHRAFRAGTLEPGALGRFVAAVARALLATPMDAAELTRELERAGVKLDVRAA